MSKKTLLILPGRSFDLFVEEHPTVPRYRISLRCMCANNLGQAIIALSDVSMAMELTRTLKIGVAVLAHLNQGGKLETWVVPPSDAARNN